VSKEIERKWLWNYNAYPDFYGCLENEPHYTIKDYYFNDYCRLRTIDGIWWLTIKSKGDIIREEYEFLLDKNDIDFIPTPMLVKERFEVDRKPYTYEINVFRDLNLDYCLPLITVELELPSPHIVLDNIPDFCGQEITYNTEAYGYNLFKIVQEQTRNRLKKKSKNNIIYLKDFLDKN